MLKTFNARDGHLTAEWNGVLLHSAYSPVKEVKKFLDSRLEPHARTVIIMGDPLGHISREVLLRNSGLKIIQISFSSSFTRQLSSLDQLHWDPGHDQGLHQFLSVHLTDLDLIQLTLLIWVPTAKIFPDLSEEFTQIINQFIRERKGSLFTTGGFGKKWLRNSIKNYLCLTRPSLLSLSPDKPVFIAASGYSLNQDITILKKNRHRFFLWALPSAVLFLCHHGIIPDLIIQTDPGFYTRYHLRSPEYSDVPLAMPLSSSLESGQHDRQVFLFSQGHFFEAFFLDSLGTSYITLPSTGTVAASALQLGILSRSPLLVIGGLDLMSHDIHEHVIPNGFFPFLHNASHKITPALTQAYHRTVSHGRKIEEGWQNEQLRTYTEWLNRFSCDSPAPLFRFNPSVVPLKGFQPVTGEELSHLLSHKGAMAEKVSVKHCIISKEKKLENVDKILNFFIESLKQAELTNKTVDLATNTRSLVFHLFSYLSLPQLISVMKSENVLPYPLFNKSFSDLSEKTIAVIEELKKDFLS